MHHLEKRIDEILNHITDQLSAKFGTVISKSSIGEVECKSHGPNLEESHLELVGKRKFTHLASGLSISLKVSLPKDLDVHEELVIMGSVPRLSMVSDANLPASSILGESPIGSVRVSPRSSVRSSRSSAQSESLAGSMRVSPRSSVRSSRSSAQSESLAGSVRVSPRSSVRSSRSSAQSESPIGSVRVSPRSSPSISPSSTGSLVQRFSSLSLQGQPVILAGSESSGIGSSLRRSGSPSHVSREGITSSSLGAALARSS